MHANGDAPFTFQVHRVQGLGLEVALADRPGLEQELVGKGALAMIDVGDDGKVAN